MTPAVLGGCGTEKDQGGAVKDDAPAALKLAAFQHLGLKFKHVAVKIV